jgi:MFS family permease
VTLGGAALSAGAVSWAAASWLQARAASAGIRRALVTSGSALIGAGIVITALVLLPSMPVLVAAAGWIVAGLGMGLSYSMLALVMLETSEPGQEGFSSSAFQLMFTLGTAFGAGIGGAIVAVAESGALELAPAIAIVFGIMVLVALLTVGVSARVPRGPSDRQAATERLIPSGVPLEHP